MTIITLPSIILLASLLVAFMIAAIYRIYVLEQKNLGLELELAINAKNSRYFYNQPLTSFQAPEKKKVVN